MKLCLTFLGASSGIGQDVALRFASLQCNVILNGRNKKNLEKVTGLCLQKGLKDKQVMHKFQSSRRVGVLSAFSYLINLAASL